MNKSLSAFKSLIIIFTCIFITIPLFAGNYAFPQSVNYPYGIRSTNWSSNVIQDKYNTWKSAYVVNRSSVCSGCLGVVSPESVPGYGGGYTVSEGIAYGMLMSVYMDDQTTFDGLAKFKINRGNAATGKPGTLLPWIIDSNGNIIDQGSATDADIDIAFAFMMADMQWGGGAASIGVNYSTQALTEISNIKSYDVSFTGDLHIHPGDQWDDHTFPSYFITAFLRAFAEFTGDNTWNSVADKANTMINSSANSSNGLVGEIINNDGSPINYNKNGVDGSKYDYNSCRVPWRTAMEYAWYGTSWTDTYTTKLANFFGSKGATGVVDGYYYQNGTQYGWNNNASFVGPAGCSFMVTTNQTSLNNFYSRTSSFSANESYYNGALQVLTMLFMSGNMPNYRLISPQPTPTATTVPDGQVIDYFEDYLPYLDTANDWGGYWYTWADAKGLGATVYPAQDTHLTMTAGGPGTAEGLAEDSLFYLRITGSKAAAVDPNYPSVGVGTELKEDIKNLPAGQDVVDLTDFWITNVTAGDGGGIRFWCKGDGVTPWKIMAGPKGAGTTIYMNWASHEYEFTPPATWTQVSIPFGSFTQPSWSTAEQYDFLTEVLPIMQEFKFQVGTNDAVPAIDFAIDNVELFPFLWEPTPLPTDTPVPPTATPTITATYGPSELLDDCEDDDGTNNWGGSWFTYDDSVNSGDSVISPIPGGIWYMTADGADGTSFSARMTGTVTDTYSYGFAGMGTNLDESEAPVNCNGFIGIRFWAKADGHPYTVKLITDTINTGDNDYKFNFTPPAPTGAGSVGVWQQYQISFAEFTQEDDALYWGVPQTRAAVLGDLKAIHFQTVGQPWPSVDFYVDEVELYPNQSWTRTPTVTPPATETFTPTETDTVTDTATVTDTPTDTQTPVPPTETSTDTDTATPTDTQTFTETPTETETDVPPTETFTATDTDTVTITDTPTETDTETPVPPTETFTETYTETNTETPTDTPTDTDTETPVPPTETFTETPTDTNTETFTETPTDTMTPTETNTPVPGVDLLIVSASITTENIFGCIDVMPPLGTSITIRNDGSSSSGAFDIDVNSGADTINITDLGAGMSQTVWTSAYDINPTIIIDSGSMVPEFDETNNTYSSPLAIPTPFPTCSQTPTETDTFTETFTETFTITYTETETPTQTETFTQTDTPMDTETPTETSTGILDTATETYTPVDTFTETPTETDTLVSTATETFTAVDTDTPTETATGSPVDTWTYTETPTDTDTPMDTATNTPMDTSTNTPTGTYTFTYTYTFTNTYTPTQTATPTLGVLITNVLPGVSIPITVGVDTSATVYFDTTQDLVAASVTLKDIMGTVLAGPKFFNGLSIPQGSGSLAIPLNNAATGFDLAALGLLEGTDMYLLEISVNSINSVAVASRAISINNPITRTPTETYTTTNTYTMTDTYTPVNTNTFTFTYTPTETHTPTGPTATPTNTPYDDPDMNLQIVSISPLSVDTDNAITENILVGITFDKNVSMYNVNILEIGSGGEENTVLSNVAFGLPSWNAGTQSITIPETAIGSLPAGDYYIQVIVNDFDPANRDTAVSGISFTVQNLSNPTFTPSPTPTQGTGDTVDDLIPYPNPSNPDIDGIRIKFKIGKHAESITFKMYTSASRLIRQVEVPAAEVYGGLRNQENTMHVPAKYFEGVAKGIYYYVLIVKPIEGEEIRSKADKIIILR